MANLTGSLPSDSPLWKGSKQQRLPGVFHNATVKKEILFLPFPAVKRQLLTAVLKAQGLRRNNQPEVRRASSNTFTGCSPAGNNGCQGLSPTFNSNLSLSGTPTSGEAEGNFRSYERERKRLPNQTSASRHILNHFLKMPLSILPSPSSQRNAHRLQYS